MSQPRPVVPVDERHDRLSKSEQQYRNLVEVSPDAILLNRGGQVALANPACSRLFGARDASELVGRPAIDLFHPDHHDVIRQRIASVIAGMSVPLLEEKIIRLDGQVRDVEVVAAAFPDEDGTAIQVVLRDVTDRKRSEAALKEDERRLRARAAEIQALLDTVPAAVWIARDDRGTLIESNRFGAELLRRQPGTNVSLTAVPEERPMNFRVLRNGVEVQPEELPVQAAARLGQDFRNVELDIVFDDGTVRHILGNAAPIRGDDDQPQGSVAALLA
jgi:PAS domain S-box-containing protein